jgi:hypothetical protein
MRFSHSLMIAMVACACRTQHPRSHPPSPSSPTPTRSGQPTRHIARLPRQGPRPAAGRRLPTPAACCGRRCGPCGPRSACWDAVGLLSFASQGDRGSRPLPATLPMTGVTSTVKLNRDQFRMRLGRCLRCPPDGAIWGVWRCRMAVARCDRQPGCRRVGSRHGHLRWCRRHTARLPPGRRGWPADLCSRRPHAGLGLPR